jgi:hypothetical protein
MTRIVYVVLLALLSLNCFGQFEKGSNSALLGGHAASYFQANLHTYVTKTASDTLELTDAYKTIRMFKATATTISIPANVFPVGSWINFLESGAGQTTFIPLAGMTMRSADAATKMRVQGSPVAIEFDSIGVCTLYGDITN